MEWKHNGHTIRVTSMGMFVTDVDTTALTLQDAREQIDEYERRERSSRKERINLPVVDNEGECRVISGVHAGNRSILLNPRPANKYGTRRYYADHANTRELVTRRKRLRDMLDAIEDALAPARVSVMTAWSATYEARLADLKEEYREALEAAEAINLDGLPLG